MPWRIHRDLRYLTKMRFVRLLATLTLTLTLVGVRGHDPRVRGHDRAAANHRRHRHRYNPYAVPTESVVDEDYDEVEVSSYCRESVDTMRTTCEQ